MRPRRPLRLKAIALFTVGALGACTGGPNDSSDSSAGGSGGATNTQTGGAHTKVGGRSNTAGEGGDSGDGGTRSGSGGRSDTGGAVQAGGMIGEGGTTSAGGASPEVPGVGELGQPCTEVGILACNGIGTRGQLICGTDHTWQANGTCNGTRICAVFDAETRGTCQEPNIECERSLSGQFCNEGTVYDCTEDGLQAKNEAPCEVGSCACAEDPCVDDTEADCTGECGSAEDCIDDNDGCLRSIIVEGSGVWAPGGPDLCSGRKGRCTEGLWFDVILDQGMSYEPIRVSAAPGVEWQPWDSLGRQ
jgi:hypothetical protein